jgi:hypothetical protein
LGHVVAPRKREIDMPEVESAGRYRAQVLEAAWGKSKNGVPFLGLRFLLTEQLMGEAWEDVSAYQFEAVYQHYIKFGADKGGGINEKAIARLVEVFNWNGTDLAWLVDTQLPDCQVTIEDKPWEGRDGAMHPQLKITWINRYDDTRGMGNDGMPRSDAEITALLQNELGASLRALSGGASAPAAPPSRRTAPSPQAVAKDEIAVHDAFVTVANAMGTWTQKQVENVWNTTIAQFVDAEGYLPEVFSPAQCAKAEKDLAVALAEHKRDAVPEGEAPWPGEEDAPEQTPGEEYFGD